MKTYISNLKKVLEEAQNTQAELIKHLQDNGAQIVKIKQVPLGDLLHVTS